MFNVQFVAYHIFAESGLPIVGIARAEPGKAIDTTISKTKAIQLLLQLQIVQQMMLLLLLLLVLLLLKVTQVLEDLLCVLLIGIVGTAEEIRQLGGCETGGLVTFQITIHNCKRRSCISTSVTEFFAVVLDVYGLTYHHPVCCSCTYRKCCERRNCCCHRKCPTWRIVKWCCQ